MSQCVLSLMALLLVAPWLKAIAALPSFFIWLWNLFRRLYTSFWHTLVQRPLAEDSGVALLLAVITAAQVVIICAGSLVEGIHG